MNRPAREIEIERPPLYHYSRDVVTEVRSSDPMLPGCGVYKPAGFWVSIDERDADGEAWGWADWCEAENFSLENLAVRHEVQLAEPERLLWITTPDDLDWFDSVFGEQERYGLRGVVWPLVANQFAGLVIAPYQWSRRFDINWYYSWDCASGVIWDASVIASISPVQPKQANEYD